MPGPHHRLLREKVLIHRSHVDVPAFALWGLHAWEIAHRGLSGLDVGRDRTYHELALKRINRDARVGHGTVAIGQPVDMRAEKLATLIVGIDVRREQDFGIRVDNGPRIDRLVRLTDLAARSRLQNVHMPHLPGLGAGAGAVIGFAGLFG